MFPVPLANGSSKHYFPFEESDHIPPSPKTNFCESPQPRHCLVTIFCHLAFRVFPHWMTDGVATAHLVPKVCSPRTSRWAWQPATGAIKVREKEESESLSAPNPANPFSFLERFPFFNLPFRCSHIMLPAGTNMRSNTLIHPN